MIDENQNTNEEGSKIDKSSHEPYLTNKKRNVSESLKLLDKVDKRNKIFKIIIIIFCLLLLALLALTGKGHNIAPLLTLVIGIFIPSFFTADIFKKKQPVKTVHKSIEEIPLQLYPDETRGSLFTSFKKYKYEYLLAFILLVSVVLRFRKLAGQSLWLDELTTINEANPFETWRYLFDYLKCCDQHPPLFFICERLFFSIFGQTEWTARCLCALAGIASVGAMYALGKEINNKRTGLIAAALCCVNYFNIAYSQEARGYMFLWLFTSLSYLFFIKICKRFQKRDVIFYVISTVLLLYSHYFSLLVVCCQLLMFIIFWILEKENKRRLFKTLFIAESMVLAFYLPWLPVMLAWNGLKSFWIKPLKPDFFIDFFKEYFGNSDILFYLVILSLLFFLFHAFKNWRSIKNYKESPLLLGFIFVFTTVLFSLGIPYARSVLVVPMLVSRYTIIILPSLLIGVAYGMELIKISYLRQIFLSIFLLLSLNQLFYVRRYYEVPSKTQFREMTAFISMGNKTVPVVSEVMSWYHQYYFSKYQYKGIILSDTKGDIIDSIIHKNSPKYSLDTFWLVGAHGAPKLDSIKAKELNAAFVLVRDTTLLDAWAQQYVIMSLSDNNYKIINYTSFNNEKAFNLSGQNVIALWTNNPVVSDSIFLDTGKFKIAILSKGTPARNIYPHINVFINENKIGDYFTTPDYKGTDFYFEHKLKEKVIINFIMDNDFADTTVKEDRNAFIQYISIKISTNSNNR